MTREQFFDELDKILIEGQFIKEGDTYTIHRITQTNPQVVVINGSRTESPGQIIDKHISIHNAGDGYICDIDDSNMRWFTEFFFTTEINKVQQPVSDTFLIYWDDINYFINIINSIIS